MRVAAIDIGTNTVLLLIAEQRPDGTLVAVEEAATITRLGQGVDATGELAPEAIARTTACLDDYAARIAQAKVHAVDVVGTSAMRDAKGGAAVANHVRAALGVDARVISGDEEAELTFVGALAGLGDDVARGGAVVFDIGGGSTEVVSGTLEHGAARLGFKRSYDMGSVRLTERHVKSDPPTRDELAAVKADVARIATDLPPLPVGAVPIGIAGTVTTLAAVALGLEPYDGARVHGAVMPVTQLAAVVDRLAALPLAERRNVAGLQPKRADVIVAGGLIALGLLQRWGATSVRLSDRGVRWGLALRRLTST